MPVQASGKRRICEVPAEATVETIKLRGNTEARPLGAPRGGWHLRRRTPERYGAGSAGVFIACPCDTVLGGRAEICGAERFHLPLVVGHPQERQGQLRGLGQAQARSPRAATAPQWLRPRGGSSALPAAAADRARAADGSLPRPATASDWLRTGERSLLPWARHQPGSTPATWLWGIHPAPSRQS